MKYDDALEAIIAIITLGFPAFIIYHIRFGLFDLFVRHVDKPYALLFTGIACLIIWAGYLLTLVYLGVRVNK